MTSAAFTLRRKSPNDLAMELIERGCQRQPFYVFDIDEAHFRIQRFKRMLPRVQIFYAEQLPSNLYECGSWTLTTDFSPAMKANDTEMMLKLAVALGLGFDCASPGEISKILQMHVSPSSIIYAAPSKTPEQIKYARASGVRHTTFDSSYELKKIKLSWPDARLLIRIRVDGDSVYKLGEKYGCDYDTEAVNLLEEAASLGLNVIGVAFHVGSACSSIDAHVVGLERAKALFDHEARAGRRMKIIDIGGGFFCDDNNRFDMTCSQINEALDTLFPDPDVQVIAEPGRYLCDTSFTLYCNISNVRTIANDGHKKNIVYLNDGIHGTLSTFESWYPIERLKLSPDMESGLEEVQLVGPTGDNRDYLIPAYELKLPPLTPHDWLVFKRQGAYTVCFQSRFASTETPIICPVISINLWVTLRESKAFRAGDFIPVPDVFAHLPLKVPPLLQNNEDKHFHTEKLD